MKFILAIAITLTSVSSFASDTIKCMRETQGQIESIRVVGSYKTQLIRGLVSAEGRELEKVEAAFENLQKNIIEIAVESCEAAEAK